MTVGWKALRWKRYSTPNLASQSLTAFSSMAWNTGFSVARRSFEHDAP